LLWILQVYTQVLSKLEISLMKPLDVLMKNVKKIQFLKQIIGHVLKEMD